MLLLLLTPYKEVKSNVSLLIALILCILFGFVQEYHQVSFCNFYLHLDLYFSLHAPLHFILLLVPVVSYSNADIQKKTKLILDISFLLK